jgi:anti-sigma factor RsiW
MTCGEYRESFLTAHADDELIGRDRRAADDHVGRCAGCRTALAQERRLKALVRTRFAPGKVPPDLRLRIRAALGEISDAPPRRPWRETIRRAARRPAALRRRLPLGIAAALAASLILALALKRQTGAPVVFAAVPPTPTFDYAVSKYEALAEEFVPNAAVETSSAGADYAWVIERESHGYVADEVADLAEAYRNAEVPEDVYDFAGYRLAGGRIDSTDDGAPATFTLYRSQNGEIISICLRAPNFYAPVGARYWAGSHTFYEYAGHSLCLTFHPDHYVSIVVADEPVAALLRDVTSANVYAAVS